MRLGQRHGAGPGPLRQLLQEPRLELRRAVRLERLHGAMRQAGIEAEGQVGGADHLLDELVDAFGQALAAEGGIARQRRPAARAKQVVRLAEPRGRPHDAVLDPATLAVAGRVQRQDDLGGEPRRFVQHAVHHVRRGVGEGGQGGDALETVKLVEDEAHVAQRGVVDLHGVILECCPVPLPLGRWSGSAGSAGARGCSEPWTAALPEPFSDDGIETCDARGRAAMKRLSRHRGGF